MLVRIALDHSRPASCQINLARQEGLEPPAYCLEGSCSIQLSYWRISNRHAPACSMERVMGIEPTYPAWKAGVLPLNYTRRFLPNILSHEILSQQGLFVKPYL